MAGEWRELPFSQAVTVNPRVQLTRGATYPFVDMGAVSAGSRSAYASEQRQFDGGGSRFVVGDTLMARITPCLENGKIARFAGLPGEIGHGSTEFIVIRGRDGVSDTDYAYYLTKWEGVSGYAISQMTGTSGRQRVPSEALDHLKVLLPPLSEQRAIAHILGALDDKIELNRRMSETLEAMARALFKAWFVDFEPVRAKMEGRWRRGETLPGLPAHLYDLFPDRLVDSELGEIPKGWGVGTIGDVAEHNRRSVQPGQIAPDTPYIALEHMPRRCIALPEWGMADGLESNKFRFKKGEILFGKLRPYFHKVGVAPIDGVCSTDIVVVTPRSDEWFGFVLGHVSSVAFVEYTNAGSSGTKMPRTSWEDMARYEVVLPPERLAAAFAGLVRPFIEQIMCRIHESRALATLRDTLLPKLISGELRVKDAETFLERVAA
ncbi:restriction endonuclease subunit S [Vulcaniibacterium gelatinicum]|uniref:restriction endonuclease subunit S n=1 Tax=Vulcaniibacterium gelatinicum TaxID=2598725 RepID=UPI0011CCC8E2|nr:restriction endonuclease subunit S [Vulcaniibacterium gelatinicum]